MRRRPNVCSSADRRPELNVQSTTKRIELATPTTLYTFSELTLQANYKHLKYITYSFCYWVHRSDTKKWKYSHSMILENAELNEESEKVRDEARNRDTITKTHTYTYAHTRARIQNKRM